MSAMFSGLLGLFVLFLVIVIPIWLLIFLFSGAKKADEESEKEFNAQLTNLSEGSKAAYILAYNGRKKAASLHYSSLFFSVVWEFINSIWASLY